MKFLGASTPDGMVAYMSLPYVGKRHDSHILRRSGFNSLLRDCQLGNYEQYTAYGDKAFKYLSHVRRAFKHGVGYTPTRRRDNKYMKLVRIAVEWAFGKVDLIEGFVANYSHMKLQMSQVGKYYIVATLLTNMHTCLYGSQASIYFGVKPPSLGEYMNAPNLNV
jgi:nuclease HARBI1